MSPLLFNTGMDKIVMTVENGRISKDT